MVRCSHCGVEFSEWAARCPSCRRPVDPATPTSGAPATEPGGLDGTPPPRTTEPAPDVGTASVPAEAEAVNRQLPTLTSTTPASQPPADPVAGNGHSPPTPPRPPVVQPVIQLEDAPQQAPPFQRGRQVPGSQRTAPPASPDPVKPE